MRRVWEAGALLGAVLTCCAAFAPGARASGYQGIPQFVTAAAGTETDRVTDGAEAWFFTLPVNLCGTPLGGCAPGAPSPVSPYPADTLHVGVVLGQETSRTYLQPDLTKLASGEQAVSGVMTLPVASGTTDGTLFASNAAIRACLATQRIPDGVQGSTAPPPTIDCTISSPLKYNPTRGGRFRVDLTPFLTAWAQGKPDLGIALVPAADPQLTDVWQVAFSGRHRQGVETITSALQITAAAVPTPAPSVAETPDDAAPESQPPIPSLPPAVSVPEPGPPPVLAQPPTTQARAAYIGYQYPAAFLIPLGLLGLATFLMRLFTRDLTPRRR